MSRSAAIRLRSLMTYETRWRTFVQRAAIFSLAMTLLIGITLRSTWNKIQTETDGYRVQAETALQTPVLEPEERAAQADLNRMMERLEGEKNVKSAVLALLNQTARRCQMQVLGIEVADDIDTRAMRDSWHLNLFRARLRGPAEGVREWLRQLQNSGLILFPLGIQINARERGRVEVNAELQIVLPPHQGAERGEEI